MVKENTKEWSLWGHSKMTDNQKLALLATASIIVFLALYFRAEAQAYKEHARKVKYERILKIECIRSGNCE